MTRSIGASTLRWAIIILPLLGISLAPSASLIPFVSAAALLSYDGPRHRNMIGLTMLLLGIECIVLYSPGMITMPFLATCLLMRIVSAYIAVPSVTVFRTWSPSAMVRVALSGVVELILMLAGSVAVASWLYGAGYLQVRMASMMQVGIVLPFVALLCVQLVLIRSVDAPLRRTTL